MHHKDFRVVPSAISVDRVSLGFKNHNSPELFNRGHVLIFDPLHAGKNKFPIFFLWFALLGALIPTPFFFTGLLAQGQFPGGAIRHLGHLFAVGSAFILFAV